MLRSMNRWLLARGYSGANQITSHTVNSIYRDFVQISEVSVRGERKLVVPIKVLAMQH